MIFVCMGIVGMSGDKKTSKMNRIIDCLALAINNVLLTIQSRALRCRLAAYTNIHSSVQLGLNVQLIGPRDSFVIGEGSYINDAIITAGSMSKVTIGKRCSIGYRVSIKARTHDVNRPCMNDKGECFHIERDIGIGDDCWIGDNVFIKEGVSIGSNVVIGANSVVTKSFPDNVVVAGVPAIVIRRK